MFKYGDTSPVSKQLRGSFMPTAGAPETLLIKVQQINRDAINLASQRKLVEASALLVQALALAPNHANSHHNLGAINMMLGKELEAAKSFHSALALEPNSAKGHFNLANIYRKSGETVLAVFHLNRVLEIDPKHHSASHILAATTGRTSDRAPNDYIQKLFDQYAVTFEVSLTRDLEYKTPELIEVMLTSHLQSTGKTGHFTHALDLGCGTGLVSQALKLLCPKISGVDLSPAMLDQARKKATYFELHQAEMVAFLVQTRKSFDLFIASDALIYIGNLKPLFEAVRKRAMPNAYFIFSTEASGESDFSLTQTGRYTHSESYIQNLAEGLGMTLLESEKLQIRKESYGGVLGELFLMKI